MEVNGAPKRPGYKLSSKYLPLCSAPFKSNLMDVIKHNYINWWDILKILCVITCVPQIHQARKLVCRKCKRHVTEVTGQVVCEGNRKYRLCDVCIQESGYSELITDGTDGNEDKEGLLLGVEEDMRENRQIAWVMDDDDLAEDSGADLIIQEVEDSDEEASGKWWYTCGFVCVFLAVKDLLKIHEGNDCAFLYK